MVSVIPIGGQQIPVHCVDQKIVGDGVLWREIQHDDLQLQFSMVSRVEPVGISILCTAFFMRLFEKRLISILLVDVVGSSG